MVYTIHISTSNDVCLLVQSYQLVTTMLHTQHRKEISSKFLNDLAILSKMAGARHFVTKNLPLTLQNLPNLEDRETNF